MELEELEKNIKTMLDDMPKVVKDFAGEEGAEILKGTIEKTQRRTGTLQRSWHYEVIQNPDNSCDIRIYNNVKYAAWYEKGHRIVRNGKTVGRVKGFYPLAKTITFYRYKLADKRADKYLKRILEKYKVPNGGV